MSTPADEDLMLAAGRGDMTAFGEIVRRHQTSAWSAAYRLLGDAAEAEDAAQDAFLKILDAAPRYRPTASFRTYLYRVVTRLCLDRLQKKRPTYVDRLPPSASDDPSPPDVLARQEAERSIQRALDALPARQRAALVLRYFEDMSYQEIADAMDASVKAVERLLARARDRLQYSLKEFRKE
jgi:RNA polymerase sigma-70 factor, ECF subfamily